MRSRGFEHRGAVGGEMIREVNAVGRASRFPASSRLRFFERHAAQIVAVQIEQIEQEQR